MWMSPNGLATPPSEIQIGVLTFSFTNKALMNMLSYFEHIIYL